MGLFDELMEVIKESVDEANKRQSAAGSPVLPQRPPMASVPAGNMRQPDLNEMKRRARLQLERDLRPPAAEAAGAAALQVVNSRPEPVRPASTRIPVPVVAAAPLPVNRQTRYALLLHQPQTLRDLFLLKELLDVPVALKRLRGRGR